jgi:mRNA interferase MazF
MYRFARPDKRRPVLVLSRLAALAHIRTAIVAPITTTIRGLPSEVLLDAEHGLKRKSAVNLDHLFTVPQADLRQWVGHVHARRMRDVCAAAAVALGCD